MTTIKPSQSTASYKSIKLGIDAHAKYYRTSCKLVKNRRAAECYSSPLFWAQFRLGAAAGI
jgi:hypothetical protein